MCHWDQLGKELLIPGCCWRGNPVLMGAFPWIYSRGQVCYANPAGAGWSNKRIPGPVVPGCSSIPGFLTLQGGTTWDRLGKSSQSPAGIFVLPGNRRGEGSERGWGHGRPVLVLCQRLWGHKSPDLVFPFQFLLARLGAAPGPPELPPRALSSAGQTPACPGSFFQLFLFKERGGKKRFPSFFLGWATSVLAWSSLSPPAPGSARPRHRRQDRTSSLPHPGAWARSGFFHFPQGRIFLTVQPQRGNRAEPVRSCVQLLSGRDLGAGHPPCPCITPAAFPAPFGASVHHSRVFPVPGIARSQLRLPFVRSCLCVSVSAHIFSL